MYLHWNPQGTERVRPDEPLAEGHRRSGKFDAVASLCLLVPRGSKHQIGTLIIEYAIVNGLVYNIVPRGFKYPTVKDPGPKSQ